MEKNSELDRTSYDIDSSKEVPLIDEKKKIMSQSGKKFASIDHYIAEAIVQNCYPKSHQEDLELIEHQDEDLTSPELKSKSWTQRAFGPLNPGSLRGSIFALMSSALGAGGFALSNSLFMKCGFIIGIVFLIGTSLLTLLSLNLLMKCAMKSNVNSYPDLAEYCFGKWAGSVIRWALIVCSFGIACGFQIIISQLFFQILKDNFYIMDYECLDQSCLPRTIQLIVVAVIILPICLLRDFYALRHVTIIGVCAFIYSIVVVLVQTPSYMDHYYDPSKIAYAHFDFNLLTGYTSALFAFMCFTVVFPIRKELKNPVEKRINKIFNRSILVEVILYMILGVSGYFSLLTETPGLVIQRDALAGSSDIAMIIAKISIILFLFVAVPININPGRAQVINVIKGKDFTDYDKKLHYIITLVFLFGSCVVGIVFPKINAVFSFLGGACGTLFGVTFPALMWVKLNNDKWNSPLNLLFIVGSTILTIIGYSAAILSLLTAFDTVKI